VENIRMTNCKKKFQVNCMAENNEKKTFKIVAWIQKKIVVKQFVQESKHKQSQTKPLKK